LTSNKAKQGKEGESEREGPKEHVVSKGPATVQNDPKKDHKNTPKAPLHDWESGDPHVV